MSERVKKFNVLFRGSRKCGSSFHERKRTFGAFDSEKQIFLRRNPEDQFRDDHDDETTLYEHTRTNTGYHFFFF